MSSAGGLQVMLRDAAQQLKDAGIPGAMRDARLLLAHALKIPNDRLSIEMDQEASPQLQAEFSALVGRRIQHQPMAQILGQREFYGRNFRVTSDVLDPRPDTELIIDSAMEHPFSTVLDLGTGTGCILLSLLCERPGSTGIGTDISPKALDVAGSNAKALHVTNRVHLIQSDWFANVSGMFDLIVSNPPYVSAKHYAQLEDDVRKWEPEFAITPGGDGLTPYRVISQGAAKMLTPGGRLIVEIGYDQGIAVQEMFTKSGFTDVSVRKDLNGKDRVVQGRI